MNESSASAAEERLLAPARRLRGAVDHARVGLIDREVLVELVALAAVAREHLLVIGPPGTAKSAAVRRVALALGGRYFEYLLGRFTEPAEIFGPIDLRKLQEGRVETATAGMLPEAEIAFLDEVFQGSTAILNTLLSLLNDRRFRRGHTVLDCPLRLAVGAANAVPEDPSLAAFADRFLLRQWVEPIGDPLIEDLLEGGWGLDDSTLPGSAASLDDLDLLATAVPRVALGDVRSLLAQALRQLRAAGVRLSDRRAVKSQRLLAAAAVLDGRLRADHRDLWPLVYVVPDEQAQALAREVLRDLLATSANAALVNAAEDASRGPEARARRLAVEGRKLLDEGAGDDGDAWRLKLEGLAREIDAGFADDHRPDELADVYRRTREILARDRRAEAPG